MGPTPKIFLGVNGFGAKSQSPLGRSPRNFAKQCELTKWSFIVYVQKLGYPKKFFWESRNSKCVLTFSVCMRAYSFVDRISNLTQLFHVMCSGAGIIIWVQLFGAPAPLKFGRAKTVQNSARFRTTYPSIANISGKDDDIDKRKTALSPALAPTCDEKKMW